MYFEKFDSKLSDMISVHKCRLIPKFLLARYIIHFGIFTIRSIPFDYNLVNHDVSICPASLDNGCVSDDFADIVISLLTN